MKPICVPCERFMRPKKNDFAFVEGMLNGEDYLDRIPAGKGSNDYWKPYKLWHGDLWECPTCNNQVVVGVAQQPLSEHYMPNFKEKVVFYNGMKLFVKDC